MQEFDFTLILAPSDVPMSVLEEKLFEAGCDDALLGSRDGIVFLDFTRRSSAHLDAITSAIREIEDCQAGLRVVRVEPD